MRILAFVLATFLLQDPAPAPFLQLKKGAVWTYVTGGAEGKVSVAGSEKIGESEVFALTTEMGGSSTETEYLISDAAGIRLVRQGSGERKTEFPQPLVRLKLPLKKGESWEWKGDIGKEKATVTYTNDGEEDVTVPAGTYKAWKISAVIEIGGVKHTGANWFVQGVGLVRQQSRFESGGKKHESLIELKNYEPGA